MDANYKPYKRCDTRDAADESEVTRRDFLRVSGLCAIAAAGSLSNSQPSTPQPSAPTPATVAAPRKVGSPVRLGVAGGNFGAQFYWHEHPQCVVSAVTDLIPERREYLKEVYGCKKAYPSLEEMLEDPELDAIAVFTPATDMVDHCIACLEKGKHVVGASPAAMSLDEARRLRDAVDHSGLTYMMAETSYFYQPVISARKWYEAGQFGNIFCTEAEYHHPGLEKLFVDDAGNRTWRYGLPPMLYSTHCTGQLIGVTGERLTEVTCYGWGDDSPILKDNPFKNPFWGETALFKTERGNTVRAAVYWRGALGVTERAIWMGDKMSFFPSDPNGGDPIIRRTQQAVQASTDGETERLSPFEKYDQTLWWETDMLPPPLRHISGHDGSHTFLTHAFIQSLLEGKRPAMDVDMALTMAIPGIIAHQSAMQGGKKLMVPQARDL